MKKRKTKEKEKKLVNVEMQGCTQDTRIGICINRCRVAHLDS